MQATSDVDIARDSGRDSIGSSRGCTPRASAWPLERVLFALAGTMTLLSAVLAATVSIWFLLLTAFVGVNQWLYVLAGACPASIGLRRMFSLPSVIYPGQRGEGA